MNSMRLSITLPESLVSKLKSLIGPRERSKFIASAVEDKIAELEEAELQKQLEEGYKERKEESLFITKDFESVDLEDWDES